MYVCSSCVSVCVCVCVCGVSEVLSCGLQWLVTVLSLFSWLFYADTHSLSPFLSLTHTLCSHTHHTHNTHTHTHTTHTHTHTHPSLVWLSWSSPLLSANHEGPMDQRGLG